LITGYSDVIKKILIIIIITNGCFENVAQFRYLGMTVRNKSLIQEEIKRRLNSGNACCHSDSSPEFAEHKMNLRLEILLHELLKMSVTKSRT
jgi:hypothetical protein